MFFCKKLTWGDSQNNKFDQKCSFGPSKFSTKIRTEKTPDKTDRGTLGRSAAGGMCTAGGRVREGKPSLVWTGMDMIQDAWPGAADDGKRWYSDGRCVEGTESYCMYREEVQEEGGLSILPDGRAGGFNAKGSFAPSMG